MKSKRIVAAILAVCMGIGIPAGALAAEKDDHKAKTVETTQQPDNTFTTFTDANPGLFSEYHLSKYDVINIAIIGFDESSFKDIMIGPDGYVNLPYAGTVKLAGLTIPEATALLTDKLGEYLKIPSMAVMVKQYGPRKVYVMGEVAKQGIYTLGSDYMNVFAALSSAGGVAKKGRPKHIAVVRSVNGEIKMKEINFDRFIEKQDASQNIMLQDGDMIYVPKSNKIDLNEDIMPVVGAVGLFRTLTN